MSGLGGVAVAGTGAAYDAVGTTYFSYTVFAYFTPLDDKESFVLGGSVSFLTSGASIDWGSKLFKESIAKTPPVNVTFDNVYGGTFSFKDKYIGASVSFGYGATIDKEETDIKESYSLTYKEADHIDEMAQGVALISYSSVPIIQNGKVDHYVLQLNYIGTDLKLEHEKTNIIMVDPKGNNHWESQDYHKAAQKVEQGSN